MLQAEGSAGQTRDHHHCERRRTRPVGQGERPLLTFACLSAMGYGQTKSCFEAERDAADERETATFPVPSVSGDSEGRLVSGVSSAAV